MDSGDINALVVAYCASGLYYTANLGLSTFRNLKRYSSVIDKNMIAGTELTRQPVICDCGRGGAAFHAAVGGEHKLAALLKLRLASLKITKPDFRPLCIEHNGSRNLKPVSDASEQIKHFLMRFMISVRKVETSDIHSCLEHILNRLSGVRCGTESADNFCFSHNYPSDNLISL